MILAWYSFGQIELNQTINLAIGYGPCLSASDKTLRHKKDKVYRHQSTQLRQYHKIKIRFTEDFCPLGQGDKNR